MLNKDQFGEAQAVYRRTLTPAGRMFNGTPPPTEHEDRQAVMHMMRKASVDYGSGEGVELTGWMRSENSGKYHAFMKMDRQKPALRAVYTHDPSTGETRDMFPPKQGKEWREWG